MSGTVLLVVSTLDGTGPGRVLTTLAGALPDGWSPVLVATHGPRSSTLLDEARRAGIPVEHLGMRSFAHVAAVARFDALLRRYRPSVVHTRTIRADLVGRVAAARRIPVLNNLVNVYPDDSVAMHGRATGAALTRLVRMTRGAATLLVANAQAVADNARDVFGGRSDRVRVVYDGLDLRRFQTAPPADLTALGIGAGARVCLSVTRLHPQKGIGDLVATAALLRNEPDLHVVVAGDGPRRAEIQVGIDRAGLNGRVHLLGVRDDIPALLARADAFVLPSRFEGLPSAVIEAMAAGLPIVATAVGGLGELIVDGSSGWLVPASSPVALADAVRDALRAGGDRRGSAARVRAETVFSVPRMAAEFAAIYNEVAA